MSDVVPASTYADEARGPLTGIESNAAKEIGKLWTNAESRTAAGAGQAFVTNDQLKAQVTALTQRIDGLSTQTVKILEQPGGSGGVSGGGLDLRPLDNTWTGTNTWTRGELAAINNFRFLGLTSGPITSFTTPLSILLEAGPGNYQALIDVQKSSDASVFGGFIGGNAAIYVQHRAGGIPARDIGIYGVRVQVESIVDTRTNPNVVNTMAAGYFSIQNAGVNVIAYGLKLDINHKGNARPITTTYGLQINMNRMFLDGKTFGINITSINQSMNDYGLLLSGQNNVGYDRAISIGSSFWGPTTANVGLDFTYGSFNTAALMLAPAQRVIFNGPDNHVGLLYDAAGAVRFFALAPAGPGITVSVGNDGTLQAASSITSVNAGFNLHADQKINMNWPYIPVTWHYNSGGAMQFSIDGDPKFSFTNDGIIFNHYPYTVPPHVGDPPGTIGRWLVNLGGFFRTIPFAAYP